MIAIATCAEFPAGEADDLLLTAELDARGVEYEWAIWDDAAVDWGRFERVLIRSTWDYHQRRDEYVAWARSLPRVDNPAEVIEWNTDKRYLDDLAAAGLPVVPTTFRAPGEPLGPLRAESVVKPTVSAGSRDTARFTPQEQAQAEELLAAIHASGRTALIQPYLAEVDTHGETALLHYGGTFDHAIRKAPLLKPGVGPTEHFFAAETIEPRTPSPEEHVAAARILDWVHHRFGTLLYVRIDLIPSPTGPLLLELEVTEPSLFFAHSPGAAARFASAL